MKLTHECKQSTACDIKHSKYVIGDLSRTRLRAAPRRESEQPTGHTRLERRGREIAGTQRTLKSALFLVSGRRARKNVSLGGRTTQGQGRAASPKLGMDHHSAHAEFRVLAKQGTKQRVFCFKTFKPPRIGSLHVDRDKKKTRQDVGRQVRRAPAALCA